MGQIQVNEELLAGSAFFAGQENLEQLKSVFKFAQRRVLLGDGALEMLGGEC